MALVGKTTKMQVFNPIQQQLILWEVNFTRLLLSTQLYEEKA